MWCKGTTTASTRPSTTTARSCSSSPMPSSMLTPSGFPWRTPSAAWGHSRETCSSRCDGSIAAASMQGLARSDQLRHSWMMLMCSPQPRGTASSSRMRMMVRDFSVTCKGCKVRPVAARSAVDLRILPAGHCSCSPECFAQHLLLHGVLKRCLGTQSPSSPAAGIWEPALCRPGWPAAALHS